MADLCFFVAEHDDHHLRTIDETQIRISDRSTARMPGGAWAQAAQSIPGYTIHN